MSTEIAAKDATIAYNRFLGHRSDLEGAYLFIGQDMEYFLQNNSWEALGFESFAEFCEAPVESAGCGFSHREGQRAAQRYRRFIDELGQSFSEVSSIGKSNLNVILPHVDEENVDELLSKAKTLSWRDLSYEMKSLREPELGEYPTAPPVSDPVQIWPYESAPDEFKKLFAAPSHGGYIAYIPSGLTALSIRKALTAPTMQPVKFALQNMILMEDNSQVFLGLVV
jgi:hypothetical protein